MNTKIALLLFLILSISANAIFAQNDTAFYYNKIIIADILISGNSLKSMNKEDFAKQMKNGEILIKHSLNNIAFIWKFENNTIQNPEFSYKLEGYDRDWNNCSCNIIKYSDIRPGVYRFNIKFKTVENENNIGTSIQIKILPQIRQTLWFRLLSFLTIIIIIPITVLIIVLILKRRNSKK